MTGLITTTDASLGVPKVPDANKVSDYRTQIWARIQTTGVPLMYIWVGTAAEDATYLKWVNASTFASTDSDSVTNNSGVTGADVTAALDQLASDIAGVGSGDVVGPASATADAIALFSGTTGKLVKDSTVLLAALQAVSEKGAANGYASLDGSTVVPSAQISAASVTQHQAALSITESQVSDLGSYQVTTEKGVANGYCPLDGSGKVEAARLPASVVGGLQYQGSWDASLNTPTLVSGAGTQGHYYVVSADGATNLNGVTDWKIGDWAVFNGTAWEKIDNSEPIQSVHGRTGAIVAAANDYSASQVFNDSGVAGTGVDGALDTLNNGKANLSGATYSGVHNFNGATVRVARNATAGLTYDGEIALKENVTSFPYYSIWGRVLSNTFLVPAIRTADFINTTDYTIRYNAANRYWEMVPILSQGNWSFSGSILEAVKGTNAFVKVEDQAGGSGVAGDDLEVSAGGGDTNTGGTLTLKGGDALNGGGASGKAILSDGVSEDSGQGVELQTTSPINFGVSAFAGDVAVNTGQDNDGNSGYGAFRPITTDTRRNGTATYRWKETHTKGLKYDWAEATHQVLTYAAGVTWDSLAGMQGELTLTAASCTLSITNLKAGVYTLVVKQDATGNRTISNLAALASWPGGTAPTLSTGASAVDILTFISDGTNLYGTSQLNFS